jgi:subtilisin family serine protease
VGDIDSDVADIPDEGELSRFVSAEKFQKFALNSQQIVQRHVVWKKPTRKGTDDPITESSEQVLFPYQPHSNSDKFSGSVVIFNDSLPEHWPENWVAAEPATHFQALALSYEWTPALPVSPIPPVKTTWWSEQMGIKRAVSLLRQKDIPMSSILVAIVDSGLDPTHPALAPVLHRNQLEIVDNGLDDDNNGLIDDDIGYDFVTEQPTLSDPFGHGTHVAGLISNAWAGNGPLGGAPNVQIRSFRALDSSGKSNSIDLARAISAALQSQADIINCSWGGGPETQVLRDAFAAAYSKNVLVFTSAGNDGLKINDEQPVPKNYPGVIPIGAATPQNSKARFSNWGDKVVFGFAPGVEILSTLPDSGYGEKSGTSMASPIAASSGALLLGVLRAARPVWSKQQQTERALEALCKSANKQKLQKGFSKCGSLNTEASVIELIRTDLGLR